MSETNENRIARLIGTVATGAVLMFGVIWLQTGSDPSSGGMAFNLLLDRIGFTGFMACASIFMLGVVFLSRDELANWSKLHWYDKIQFSLAVLFAGFLITMTVVLIINGGPIDIRAQEP